MAFKTQLLTYGKDSKLKFFIKLAFLPFLITLKFANSSFASQKCQNIFNSSLLSQQSEASQFANEKFKFMQKLIQDYGLSFILYPSKVGALKSSKLITEIYSDFPVYAETDFLNKDVKLQTTIFSWGTSKLSYDSRVPLILGRGDLAIYSTLDGHKVNEYKFVKSIDPQIMPESVTANEIINLSNSSNTQTEIEKSLQNGGKHIDRILHSFLDSIVNAALKRFPQGAIFKLDSEQQTGDANQLLTTSQIKKNLSNFNEIEILDYIKKYNLKNKFDLLNLFTENSNTNRNLKLVAFLLKNPYDILVQKFVTIEQFAKRNVEIRVDFLNGTAVMSSTRYGFAYLPEVNKNAKDFINEFLFKVYQKYPEYQNLSGAADVVLLTDGTFKVMEWNFGNKSGFILPRFQPIEANWIITNLKGSYTHLIRSLNQIYDLPIEKQIKHLSQYSRKKILSINEEHDIYVAEVIAFLRDIAVDEAISNSNTFLKANDIINYVTLITNSIANPDAKLKKDLDEIVLTTELYFRINNKSFNKSIDVLTSNHSQNETLPLSGETHYDLFRQAYNKGQITGESKYISFIHQTKRFIGRIDKLDEDGVHILFFNDISETTQKTVIYGNNLLEIRASKASKDYFESIPR